MTDKNLADECERLFERLHACDRRAQGDYQMYAVGELSDLDLRVILDAAAALRTSAAPQINAELNCAEWLGKFYDAATEDADADTVDCRRIGLIKEIYAVGQAARAKRDVEVAKTFPADCCLDCGLALTSPIIIARTIEKDAAG